MEYLLIINILHHAKPALTQSITRLEILGVEILSRSWEVDIVQSAQRMIQLALTVTGLKMFGGYMNDHGFNQACPTGNHMTTDSIWPEKVKHCGQFIKCNNAEGCQGCEYEGEEDK